MERCMTICAACAVLAVLVGGCDPNAQAFPSATAQALDQGRPVPRMTPQAEYEEALADFEKARQGYDRARLVYGAPRFYGSSPWAAPVAIGLGLLSHIHLQKVKGNLEKALPRLEDAEARLLASQWSRAPQADPVAPDIAALPHEPSSPTKAASPSESNEPVFNHPCPHCGAGNSWQGRPEEVHCSSCKKAFRIRYAR